MIKFDLHIHSYASKYKEGKGIVTFSTIDHTSTLLEKLNEYEVSLFSITDHNRFDVELYKKLIAEVKSGRYPNVKGIVAGVEFDVLMEDGMEGCHIITIFNAKDEEDYQRIHTAIASDLLEEKTAAYSRERYERILRTIGLDVILIACQRSGLDIHEGKHRSFSESTRSPEEFLKLRYISALEFQRPNVEGILKENLRAVPTQIGLVMGSDCHDWREYPFHDKGQRNPSFQHSYANILPTFKGLLMAVTSPETRINRPENDNDVFIPFFSIGGKDVKLVNGINAIIGENGSGKSTLLKCIAGRKLKQFENGLKETNSIFGTTMSQSKIYYVEQGDIVKKFAEKKLFPNELYEPVNVDGFVTAYRKYGNELLEYIHRNIKAKEAMNKLPGIKVKYDPISEMRNHFVDVKCPDRFDQIHNPHKIPDTSISQLVTQIEDLIKLDYFKPYEEDLKKALDILRNISKAIHKRNELTATEARVKNAIVAALKEYTSRIETGASTQERKKRAADAKRQKLIDALIDTANLNTEKKSFPCCPDKMSGETRIMRNGFSFNEQTNYHERQLKDEFLMAVFNKPFANETEIKKIDTIEDFVEAVRGCTDDSDIDKIYFGNVESFINGMCDTHRYIVDGSQSSLGNTLGEMSLAYFKYITDQNNEKCVYVLDQPEDHISNRNISAKLIAYFNSIRYKKQIIIVTHNPLLVVNQDVDQVVFLSKDDNDTIHVISGCLEYDDNDSINMLDIIANNMDGGKASIEKRLRVYGKENSP